MRVFSQKFLRNFFKIVFRFSSHIVITLITLLLYYKRVKTLTSTD